MPSKASSKAAEPEQQEQEEKKKARRVDAATRAERKIIPYETLHGHNVYIVPRALVRSTIDGADIVRRVYPLNVDLMRSLGVKKRSFKEEAPRQLKWQRNGFIALQRACEHAFVGIISTANETRRITKAGSKKPGTLLKPKHVIGTLHADQSMAWLMYSLKESDETFRRNTERATLNE